MYKKSVIFLLVVFFVLLQIVNVHAETVEHRANNENFPDVKRIVTVQRMEPEPVDWPVVKETRTESYDEKTGIRHIHIIIVREQPVDKNNMQSECSSVNMTFTCVSNGDKYVQDTDIVSTSNGWIQSYAAHWQTKYCRSGESYCHFRKPYKLQIWWTRSNSSWRADNALVRWGCGGCNVCEGGTSNYEYNDGPFTPQWSGNTSYYYTYTSSQWPKMSAWDWGSWKAGSDSNALYGWQQIGQLSTNADG